MKKCITLLLALTLSFSLCACALGSAPAPTGEPDFSGEGKVFNIYAWNEEFKGFFEEYYEVPPGITVNWITVSSDDGAYQAALDAALENQEQADADEKIDMFLAEADYIVKYVDSPCTQDVRALGVTDLSKMYDYTVQAATDAEGILKGVSFQCCPAAIIYRRSIAKKVLDTDDPAEVQTALNSWIKFDVVAEEAKRQGYLMTASYLDTYRVFSNNFSKPWVDENNVLQIDPMLEEWQEQAKKYVDENYTLPVAVFSEEKNFQMYASGRTMCFFGPAWFYKFCMTNAMDPQRGCYRDWAVCQGPQPYLWGGTWLLAASGSDNPVMLADIMNTFTTDSEVCSKLVTEQSQFCNNQKVNSLFAEDSGYGNPFLGGQNDTAVYAQLAQDVKFENKTVYDQLLNEQYQEYMLDYCTGDATKEEALARFYDYVHQTYPEIITP